MHYFLCKIEKHSSENFGGKGNGLKNLLSQGIAVPETYGLPILDGSVELSKIPPPPLSFPLIIRSSANIEDAEQFSFAGVFKSVRVESIDQWKSGLREVWESMTTPRLNDLFLSQGIDPNRVRPGLIVQTWVDTEVRGVLFTRNPQNVWATDALIEWAEENNSVVDGEDQTQTISESLNLREDFKTIIQVGRKLEGELKSPLDIEWGITSDRQIIYFQCRPMTGAEAELLRATLKYPDAKFSRTLSQERFPECLTPLGWDVIRDGIPTNLSSLKEYFGFETGTPEALAVSDEGWIYNSETFFHFPGGLKLRLLMFLKRRPWFLVQAVSGFIQSLFRGKKWKAFMAATLAELTTIPLEKRIQSDTEIGKKEILHLLEDLDGLPKARDKRDVIAQIQRINGCSQIFLKPDFPIFLSRELLFKAYQYAWSQEGHTESFVEQVSRLPHNISLQCLGNRDSLAFTRTSWDIFYPSVSDQISMPSESTWKAKTEISDLSPLWRKRIARLQTWMAMDDELHHYTGVLIEASRRILLRTGELMAAAHVISKREDIFFLTLEEVQDWLYDRTSLSLAPVSHRRRMRFEMRKKSPPPLSIPPKEETRVTSSYGMSKGVAQGKLITVAHFHELEQLPSEAFILATPSANPAWINLFPQIQGWITESGGPLAHGFVAARDYGIPAISGVTFEKLKSLSGKTIRLDGTRGEFLEIPS